MPLAPHRKATSEALFSERTQKSGSHHLATAGAVQVRHFVDADADADALCHGVLLSSVRPVRAGSDACAGAFALSPSRTPR